MTGWIKLFRKLQDWQWYSDSRMVHLFIHLLLEANHEKKLWRGVEILPGQLIFGRKSFSETLGISERTIRTCMERLKSTNELTIKTTNRFSLVTIIKWEEYQFEEKKRPAKRPANGQTNDQQTTTPKEDKEDKEDKKKDINARLTQFVDFVNKTFGKKYRTYEKVKSAFKQRIEVDGYTAQEIKQVIGNLKTTEYHIETGFKYCTPEFILRTSTIEKYKSGTSNPSTTKSDYSQMNDFYEDLQKPLLKISK